jgi:hypothetical protein
MCAATRRNSRCYEDLLAEIQTPVQIIAGAREPAVPPVNAEFIHKRLPNGKLDIIDAGHFTWEDASDEYAALVTSWSGGGYATAASSRLSASSAAARYFAGTFAAREYIGCRWRRG